MVTRRKILVFHSLEAVGLATLVALTSELPFFFALAFFLVFRAGAALIADAVAEHLNPSDITSGPPIRALLPDILLLPVLAAVFTGAWMWWNHRPFFPAYSYVLMICGAVGAFYAILIEWEDNQPGGWANPKKK